MVNLRIDCQVCYIAAIKEPIMFDYEGKPGQTGNYNIPRKCGKCYGTYYVNLQLSSQPVKCPHCGAKN